MLESAVEKKKKEVQSSSDMQAFAKEFTKELASHISPDEISKSVRSKIVSSLVPLIQKLVEQNQFNAASIEKAMMTAIQNVHVTVPEIKIPEIKVPRAEVKIDIPPIRIPDVIMPGEMITKGWLNLVGWDRELLNNPIPVQLRDADGSPIKLFESLTSIVGGGGGGGGAKIVKISDIRASSSSIIDQCEGALKVTGALSATITADKGSGEIGSDTLRIVQATDAISSVNVVDAFGSTSATGVFNADNRLRCSIETGGTGLTDAELRATSVPIAQVSGANWSVEVTNTVPVSGTVAVSGITASVAASLVDSSGVQYSGSNPLPIKGPVVVTSITNTTASNIVDSTGVAYSGSNPVPVDGSGSTQPVSGTVVVSSITASTTAIIGDKAADEADGDSNPVKIGGVARTANPTAVAAGDRVSASYDKVGRQLVRPVQVRELLQTAYVTAASEGPKTLLAGVGSTFHDLVYLMCANESDAAITLDVLQSTGGTVQATIVVPAQSTAGLALGGATLPQDHADATWQVDNNAADNSNTTYAVTALFSKEV